MKKDFESRLNAIEERNRRVEFDKKWEISWVRRISITILTYITVFVYLIIIKNDNPYLNATVPAIGFLLSTLLLKSVKNTWQSQSKK